MANLDVSFLLEDDLFADSFQVVSRSYVVVNGRNQLTESTTRTIKGSVQPPSPKEVNILPEGVLINNAIKIYTKEPLIAGDQTSGSYSDKILWKNQKYIVSSIVEDYLHFGMGHNVAVAILEDSYNGNS